MTTPMEVLVRNEAECAYELAWLKGLIELGAVRQYEKELADLMERHREAVEARAAVAELIEAGNDWCDLMPGLAGGPEFDRFVAALANAGGTK